MLYSREGHPILGMRAAGPIKTPQVALTTQSYCFDYDGGGGGGGESSFKIQTQSPRGYDFCTMCRNKIPYVW